MDNKTIIWKVQEWQRAGFVHELMCLAGDTHRHPLRPVVIGDKVKLKCLICGEISDIPDFVLEADIAESRRVLMETYGDALKLP